MRKLWSRANNLGRIFFVLLFAHGLLFATAVTFSLSDSVVIYSITMSTILFCIGMLDLGLMIKFILTEKGRSFFYKSST